MLKQNSKALNIQEIIDEEELSVCGCGTVSRIATGVFEGVAISIISGLVLAEGKNLISDISLNDEAWKERKAKRDKGAFLDNLKCIGGPINAASDAYYRAHNKIVDVARTPWM